MALSAHTEVKGGNKMPENNNRDVRDFSQYDAMTSEELAQLLRLDSETPEGNGLDIDTLLYITGVLAEREKPDHTGKTAQEAWIAFQENYMPSERELREVASDTKTSKTRKPWIRCAIAAAAILLIMVFLPRTVKAVNWEELWNAVASWASETFSFIRNDQPDVDNPGTQDARTYESMQQAFAQTGANIECVPTFIPQGYVLQRVEVDETPLQQNYVAIFQNADNHITISIRSNGTTDPERVEINENLVEIYTVSGVEYYIFSNNQQLIAVWIQDSYECCISGRITLEEIKQIIDSIPKG